MGDPTEDQARRIEEELRKKEEMEREASKKQQSSQEEEQKIQQELKRKQLEETKRQQEISKKMEEQQKQMSSGYPAGGSGQPAYQYPHQKQPKKETPIIKYILLIIIFGGLGFVLYEYGPDVWDKISPYIPADVVYFVDHLVRFDFESLFNFGNTPIPETPSWKVLEISFKYIREKLPKPRADDIYNVKLNIQKFDPDPVEIEVSGWMKGTKEEPDEDDLFQDDTHFLVLYPSKFKEDEGKLLYRSEYETLSSKKIVPCEVERYDYVVANVKYVDYSATTRINYKIGEDKDPEVTKEEMGPIDIKYFFSPTSIYQDTFGEDEKEPELTVIIDFLNQIDVVEMLDPRNLGGEKSKGNYASIKTIEVGHTGDPDLLTFKNCECGKWGTLDIEGEEISIGEKNDVNILEEGIECDCTYSVSDPKIFFENYNLFKTITFYTTIVYDYEETIRVKSSRIPEIDRTSCGDDEMASNGGGRPSGHASPTDYNGESCSDEFDINPVSQFGSWGGRDWCGITSAAMLFGYNNGNHITPKTVYDYCDTSCIAWDYWPSCGAEHFIGHSLTSKIISRTESGYIRDLKNYVCNLGKPVIVYLFDYGVNHIVLVTGVTDSSVIYNDPATGKEEQKSYSDFFDLVRERGSYKILYDQRLNNS